jgi:cytochrome P450
MEAEAIAAARRLRQLLSTLVAARRSSRDFGEGDVLGRFLELDRQGISFYDGDSGIVRSIAGLQSGHLNAPNGLFVYAVNRLLALDAECLAALREIAFAAHGGDAPARAALEDHWLEAERFCVYPPFSYRHAEEETLLARGTRREKRIPKDSTVVTWQSLAAFDPDVFADPFAFAPGRPRWQYLGFGHARHRCLGEEIGQILLTEMAAALFGLPGLRRRPGRAGRLRELPIRQGRYPVRLELEHDE